MLDKIRKFENENTIFLAPCTNNETISWLKEADLSFVYYQNTNLNSAYACSTKFYTSVFAGTPIICNRLPAFEAFAIKYGGVVFFDVLSPEAIRACVEKAFQPSFYKLLKQEIREARQELISIPYEQKISQAFSTLLDR